MFYAEYVGEEGGGREMVINYLDNAIFDGFGVGNYE
jgi:hypothetical protein